jgi:hypothetical protein
MVLISKKWNGKDVEVAVDKSEVLYSCLPGETEENKKKIGIMYEPGISKIKSEALPDKPTCLAGRIYKISLFFYIYFKYVCAIKY